jgi:preprotein translocase subunit SecD
MKGGFRLFSTIALIIISLYYLVLRPYMSEKPPVNLGLDLQGGMHVTLEVGVDALVKSLASDTDDAFNQVFKTTRGKVGATDRDFIDAFVSEFEARDANIRLSRYFRNVDAGITRRSSNNDIKTYLHKQADDALTGAIDVVRNRIDRFGVTEPSIVKQGSHRIVVELPGVSDAKRVRKLLRGTAQLQFRLMGEPQEINTSLTQVMAYYDKAVSPAQADTSKAAKADTSKAKVDPKTPATKNPLTGVLTPTGGVAFGTAAAKDTSKVMNALKAVPQFMPKGITPMWTSAPINRADKNAKEEMYLLLAVRDKVELKGETITNSTVEFDQFTNAPKVTMAMNSEGSNTWSRLTGANVGKQVAVVMDNLVYSYPNINNKIDGGRTEITGLDSREEATDIVTVLKSGSLPAPVNVVEERTVGPSLGQSSIEAGKWSVILAFALIGLFMVIYYRSAGVIADIALLLNILFIFGILASFNATLTLPGIAGIVLTIGMAVDANVLAFERIREELDSGKSQKLATEVGYTKAMAAIIDSHITTFFTGAILYSFGIGPIKGFAVTLMAGVLTTLFTCLIVTRLMTEFVTDDGKKPLSYG